MRHHASEVAALAEVVRKVCAAFEARGKPVTAKARAALAAVERWLAGEPVSAEALDAASAVANEVGLPAAQREQDRALDFANAAAGNLAWMAHKPRGWQDGERTTMEMAACALEVLEGSCDRAALESIRAAALERARADKPRAKTPARASKAPARLGDQLAPFIGALANARLAKLRPVIDGSRRGEPDALRALLQEHGHPAPPAVIAFEQRYGGLIAADDPGAEGRDWTFGAFACLKSGAHATPGRGGARGEARLVPVVYSPNDVIYFLDVDGAGWAADTIEDAAPSPFAADGDRLVARLLLFQIAFDRRARGTVEELEGKLGAPAARALRVKPIPEASDDLMRAWGGPAALVLEGRLGRDGKRGKWTTLIAAGSKKALQTAVAAARAAG